ncbi:hypothetical protein F3J02_01380 [Acinetobacter sp. Tr-809]|uniref:hypothetical protein n=1 Tax=Acinetobacter sp. Tr-809 TaxID=2608324 RepID=UPI00141F05D7|nr:hypothetical protein [Acinetobacter sp. Tr-809]NIE95146.1 hypothetical protein [Acinetobacter sp. Tr-809]
MNIQKEREAFETLQNPIAFERIAYIEEANLYTMKNEFRNDLFTMTKCNELNFGWKMYQESAKRAEEKLEGCVVVPTTPSYEMWSGIARHLGRYMQMHDRYCPKTLKKYFDRFIGDIPEWLNKEVKDWDSDHAFATADLPAFIYMSMVEAARGEK